jgi:iron complex outermembrane receptor protein
MKLFVEFNNPIHFLTAMARCYLPLGMTDRCPRFALLAGASLAAMMPPAAPVYAADGAATGSNSSPAQLPAISVEATAPAPEGSAADGYRVSTGALGPLGSQSLKDTPYSVNVVSSDLMDNLQATTAAEALKYNPTVRSQLGSNLSSNYFMIRGFQNTPSSSGGGSTVDGMRQDVSFEPIEDKERIEVLNGPAGFLMGFAAPGGTLNYGLKRPTSTRLNRVTVGDYGGEQGYLHGDFSGPIDSQGRLDYRINMVKVDGGDIGVDGETHKRKLFTGVVDWHLAPDTVWSVDASHFDRDLRGFQAFFVATSASLPEAPNPSKNYAAPWAFTHDEYDRYGTSLKSSLNETFTLRTALRFTDARNSALSVRDRLNGNSQQYSYYQVQVKGVNGSDTTQGYGLLDAKFDTLGLAHKATFGVTQDHVIGFADAPGTSTVNFTGASAGGSSMLNPVAPIQPNFNLNLSDSAVKKTSRTDLRTVIAADQITLNDQWSVLGGVNVPNMQTVSYDVNTGVPGAKYDKTRITPAGAVMFKPIPAMTTYVSYVEALQQGATVPSTYNSISLTNSGQILAPYVSHQYEVGAKTTVQNTDLNLALFQIDKQSTFVDSSSQAMTVDGLEVHRGAEFTFTGKATRDVTLGGGLTWMTATITKASPSSGTAGTTPAGLPHLMGNLFGEYAVPQFPGLTLMAGGSYTGKEGMITTLNNNAPTAYIPEVFVMDAGARYNAEIYGHPTTFRLNINNLLNARYWTNKGDTFLYTGSPQTIAFSVSTDF